MRIAFFDTHRFERDAFEGANRDFGHSLTYLEPRLTPETAPLAAGFPAVCAFANDNLNATTLETLKAGGTTLIALRSAGFNHVDLAAAARLGLAVVRVPRYSPYAVAEHAMALILTLNRRTHRAYNRVRELNFCLDGLVGFDLHGKTVGVLGTGKIGAAFARIALGFGCRVTAFDVHPDPDLAAAGVTYGTLEEALRSADILSLHVPLTPETRHILNDRTLGLTRAGVMVINTGRGALIDTAALVRHLKNHHIGAAGLDVYEEEENVFFRDLSAEGLEDDTLARLLTFPNVLITSHQGFLTREALGNIAHTTLENVRAFERGAPLENEVRIP